MNRSSCAAWLFALCFAYAGLAAAGQMFDFTFDIGPNTGFGSLDTVDQGSDVFWATSGSLTVTGGLDVGTYALGAGGPGFTNSPSGHYGFDNLLYPVLNPVLDFNGLLFVGNGLEINIFGGGNPNDLFFFSCVNGSSGCQTNVRDEDQNGVFSLTAVPEPATLALLGLGLAGLGFSRRKH